MAGKYDALVKSVTVKPLTEATCEFCLGKKRFGFVGFGDPAPINWLSNETTKQSLSIEARKAVVDEVRRQMAELNAEREKYQKALLDAEAGLVEAEAGGQPTPPEDAPTKKAAK